MLPRRLFSCRATKPFKMRCIYAAMVLVSLNAGAQVQGTSAYADAWMKANAVDFANAHGYANIGFSPSIYSIRDKPFTATRVFTFHGIKPGEATSQNDSSKSTPTLSEEVIIARDNLGRVHYETRRPAKGEIAVMIYDPIAHTLSEYYLAADRGMPDNAVAKVTHFQLMSKLVRPIPVSPAEGTDTQSAESAPEQSESSSPAASIVQPPAAAPNKRKSQSPNDLPEQTINGIPAIGYRTVEKYGSDNQYRQIQEDWFSPAYAINLRNDVVRESIGESTIETRDVVDGEPDSALFHVPGGYSTTKSK
jgi:hypothetical protein